MVIKSSKSYARDFYNFSCFAGLSVILIALLVLLGWQFDIDILRSLIPGLTPMNPGGTAVCFLLTGAALLLMSPNATKKRRMIGFFCVGCILTIVILVGGSYIFGWNTMPDMLLFRDKLAEEAVVQGKVIRLAPNTALAFLFTSVALLLLDTQAGKTRPSQILAICTLLISVLTITGYACAEYALTTVSTHIPMSPFTALAFLLTSLGILCARADSGAMRVLTLADAGGTLARKLIPLLILLPLLEGWLAQYLRNHDMVDDIMARVILVLSNIIILTTFVWWHALSLSRAEKQMRNSELRYKLAVTGSLDGLWDWDITGNTLYWSDRCKEMLEIADPNFQPHYDEFKRRLHPNDRLEVAEDLEEHLRTQKPYDAKIRMRTDTGRYIWVQVRGTSVYDETDGTLRMSGTATEVTRQKQEEEDLKRAREQASMESQAKSDFLANMSHELRTPLNSIIGLNRILYEDKSVNEEHREMAGVAYRAAEGLLDVVNDILDLSKVEAGKLEFETITFSLEEVVNSVVETILPLSSKKGLIFSCYISKAGMPYFVGDAARIGRVMMNLVSNAVKYTDAGSVTVDVKWHKTNAESAAIEFSVTDTGIGIPEEKRKLIFDKFAQADSSITRRFGGTGLGLAITKQILHQMGGTIGVESAVGQGSRFWFTLPLPTATQRPAIDKGAFRREPVTLLPDSQRKKITDLKLLIAEDHVLNQLFMRKLVTRLGCTSFTIVENGMEAVNALAREPYDMVFMDCHMPVMSGYDATTAIRMAEEKSGSHIPIIAMTADAMLGTRERCLKVGMDEFISKPINTDELRHIMSRWVIFPGEAAKTPETANSAAPAPVPAAPSFDLSSLKEFAETDEDIRGFVDIFLSQSRDILNVLRENCTDGENAQWSDAGHKFKGGASMIKAEKLRALCAEAQEMHNGTAAGRRALLGQIEAAFAQVVDELDKALPPKA